MKPQRHKSPVAKREDEANGQRMIAAEIVSRLYCAGDVDQLRILEMQVGHAVELLRDSGVKPSF